MKLMSSTAKSIVVILISIILLTGIANFMNLQPSLAISIGDVDFEEIG